MPNRRKSQSSTPKQCRIIARNPRKGYPKTVKALEANVLARLASCNDKLDAALTLIYKKEGGHV